MTTLPIQSVLINSGLEVTSHNLKKTSLEVIIRTIKVDDIGKILELQEASFADMAAYGMVWPASFLKNHLRIFPEGQLCAEINDEIVASASN